jgi:tRNA U34 5-methylaminomethyl-2-thiouridine-forming methyltransferase MnmC
MDYKITYDGSKTLFSSKYNQTFHSLQDGALSESLYKHIIPALSIFEYSEELHILDICFGLGYNTFGTIYYVLENKLPIKLTFYSPEFDLELIQSLEFFEYPPEFEKLKKIIFEISKNQYYKDEQFEINLYIGDAREYIKTLDKIDIVFQDAFSSEVNKELWTKEYFCQIARLGNKKSIITTYSIATPVRLSMYENSFHIYEYHSSTKKRSTIASNFELDFSKLKILVDKIDMEKKKINNPNASPLYDERLFIS